MKKCNSCNKEKSLSEFYKHKQMKDGLLGKCKSCVKSRVAKHRIENIDSIREYDRKRGGRQDPTYLKEWREKYPKKYKAHNMINNHKRDGNIYEEPCFVCGSLKVVAHHDDYDKPLNVRWMCQAHHKQWHVEHGEGLNAS